MRVINNSLDKYKDSQQLICEPFFEMLNRINSLEKEVYTRSVELETKKEELGIPNEFTPEDEAIWEEYKQRLGEIIMPCCTEKLLSRPGGTSFGSPAKYGYINGECKVEFIMKSAKKAVIETHYHSGIDEKHKFVFKDIGGKWLLDEVYYGFENEEKWYTDNIR